jgi:hypothetical protein
MIQPPNHVEHDRQDNPMTELTPRQILDAISRALEKSARQFSKGGSEKEQQPPQPGESTLVVEQEASQAKRPA